MLLHAARRQVEKLSDLVDRFQCFMLMLPSVEGIDQLTVGATDRKPKTADYFGLGRSIVFEQKSINADQSRKIQSELDAHKDEDYYPLFYGTRDIDSVLASFPNAEGVKRRLYTRITKLLESDLSSANKQIQSTAEIFGVVDYTGVLLILNDKVKVLSPEIISRRIQQRLAQENPDGQRRFGEISYVLLISETHLYKGQLPTTVLIEGPGAADCDAEVSEYLNYIVCSWAAYNGGGVTEVAADKHFFDNLSEIPEPIADKVTRSQERRIWYSENRYMSDWSDDRVFEAGAKLTDTIKPLIGKGGRSVSAAELAEMMLAFGDIIEESNYRGLNLRDMRAYSKSR